MSDYRDYGHLLNSVTKDGDRNDLILSHLIKEARTRHYCLVLSERIHHAKAIHKEFAGRYPDITSVCLTSENTRSQRKQAIDAMNQGEINVLFATKLADEGLDIKRLDRLFLTCPVRSTNKVTQQIGRILRTFPGKQDAVVFDFLDSLCGLARSQFYTRKNKIYKNYELEEIQFEKANK